VLHMTFMPWNGFTSANNDGICSTATTGWRLSQAYPAVYGGLPLSRWPQNCYQYHNKSYWYIAITHSTVVFYLEFMRHCHIYKIFQPYLADVSVDLLDSL